MRQILSALLIASISASCSTIPLTCDEMCSLHNMRCDGLWLESGQPNGTFTEALAATTPPRSGGAMCSVPKITQEYAKIADLNSSASRKDTENRSAKKVREVTILSIAGLLIFVGLSAPSVQSQGR